MRRMTLSALFLLPWMWMLAMVMAMTGCIIPQAREVGPMPAGGDEGGGQDSVTVHLPFDNGYASQCVQGTGGSYSHTYTSTSYDLDFDTPNDVDDLVFAPTSGTVYVHDDGDSDFGLHVNIDMGDGTYILLAHLAEVFLESGDEVAAGQILGFEGTTGASTGDHVHFGRHEGDATVSAGSGTSIEGLSVYVADASTGEVSVLVASDFVCDLSWGEVYVSELSSARWHPAGTLVKTPSDSAVYLLEGGEALWIETEDVFWSYGYDFADVVLVSDEELACYAGGASIDAETSVRAVYDDGAVWLLVGDESDANRAAYRARSTAWQAVLKSWGLSASTYDDLYTDDDLDGVLADYPIASSYAQFRDGSLLTEASSSAVYVVADGVAMPVDSWDTYLLMGFGDREIIWLDDGAISSVQSAVGDCSQASYCVSAAEVTACGGSSYEVAGVDDEDDHEDQDDEGDEGDEQASEDDAGDESDVDEDESDEDSGEFPDDLGEGLDWIRTDGSSVGLVVAEVFSSSVNGEDVAVTGEGISGGWGYSSTFLTDYDASTDVAWYDFPHGEYRVTWRTSSDWALYYEQCMSTSETSSLCHENGDGSYALCFESGSAGIQAMSTADCQNLE